MYEPGLEEIGHGTDDKTTYDGLAREHEMRIKGNARRDQFGDDRFGTWRRSNNQLQRRAVEFLHASC
jgi:hypothetical protein